MTDRDCEKGSTFRTFVARKMLDARSDIRDARKMIANGGDGTMWWKGFLWCAENELGRLQQTSGFLRQRWED